WGIGGGGGGGRIGRQEVREAAGAAQPAPEPVAPSPQPAAATVPAPAVTIPAAPAPASAIPSELRGRTEKMSRLRAVIAHRMVESLQVSAQLTSVLEVDVTRIARLRDRAKAEFARREGVN